MAKDQETWPRTCKAIVPRKIRTHKKVNHGKNEEKAEGCVATPPTLRSDLCTPSRRPDGEKANPIPK